MNITIDIDLDTFTWGDLEDMESRSPRKIREVIERHTQVEGVEPEALGDYLRGLSINEMRQLSEQFQEAVLALSNPSVNGKN